MWVSNGLGVVEALDVPSKRMLGSLKGAGGSVRALQVGNSLLDPLHEPYESPCSPSPVYLPFTSCPSQVYPAGELTLIASAGLDRYLRVHDTTSRK